MPITIAAALDRIHRREYVLPAIQREFVWKQDKIINLLDSLMRGYPIGSFLMWRVLPENSGRFVFYDFMRDYHQRDNFRLSVTGPLSGQSVTGVLDGQQRLTALNIALRGSHTTKIPRRWATNPHAFPKKEVYLDLFHRGQEDELGVEYDFRFLTADDASNDAVKPGAHWFRVRDVLGMVSHYDVIRTLSKRKVADSEVAVEVLARLHAVVHTEPLVNFFLEEAQELDKVLNIFIRVNSGGMVLSYSDLLLSVASAQWIERDARETIHRVVDDLNGFGLGFAFSKDLVLKTGLVVLNKRDIRFHVDNFDRATMSELEKRWDDIEAALRLGVALLSDFGFSAPTLTANSVLIPLAYYINRRGLTEQYRTSSAHRDDRTAVRTWLQRSLMKAGVWGSGLDRLLTGLRAVLDKDAAEGWPTDAIEREMARQGKALRFDAAEIDDLLDLEYGAKRLFSMLAMLYPGVDTRMQFHEDHIFPRSLLTSATKLRKAGVGEQDIPAITICADRAPNLQLLRGAENQAKSAQLPSKWLSQHFPSQTERDSWLREYDATDLPTDVTGFVDFFQLRRSRMRTRLAHLLGVDLNAPTSSSEQTDLAMSSADLIPDPGNETLETY